METLIIILIVVMIINDLISIGVYFKNNLEKRQAVALQETVNKAQEAFLYEKKRLQEAIDNRDKTIKEWVQKYESLARQQSYLIGEYNKLKKLKEESE